MRLPPAGDQEEFYAQMLSSSRDDSERAVVMLLWRTGMHASTLCNEHWLWDGQTEYIKWFRPKTSKRLLAAVPRAELELIERVRAAGSLPNTTRTLRRWVQRIGERAGEPGICPLVLRRSRAVYLFDKGMPVNRVSSLLGCSWQVLERNYAQVENARDVLGIKIEAARLVE